MAEIAKLYIVSEEMNESMSYTLVRVSGSSKNTLNRTIHFCMSLYILFLHENYPHLTQQENVLIPYVQTNPWYIYCNRFGVIIILIPSNLPPKLDLITIVRFEVKNILHSNIELEFQR